MFNEQYDNYDVIEQYDNFDVIYDVMSTDAIIIFFFLSEIVSKENVCLNAAVLIAVMIFLGSGFVGFAVSAYIFYRKWTASESENKKLAKVNSSTGRKNSGFHGQPEYSYSSNVF